MVLFRERGFLYICMIQLLSLLCFTYLVTFDHRTTDPIQIHDGFYDDTKKKSNIRKVNVDFGENLMEKNLMNDELIVREDVGDGDRDRDVIINDIVNYKVDKSLKDLVCLQEMRDNNDKYEKHGLFDISSSIGFEKIADQYHLTSAPNCLFDERKGNRKDKGGFCFVERNTGSGAAGDFNGDGLIDVIITSLDNPPQLFQNVVGNDKKQTFKLLDSKKHFIGLPKNVKTNGASFVDVDNDGDIDLVLTTVAYHKHLLFINDGEGVFTEESEKRGATVILSPPSAGGSIAVGDFDNDGWLDLFFCEWKQDFLNENVTNHSRLHNSRLLKNMGNGFFTDVTIQAQLDIFELSHQRAKYPDGEQQDEPIVNPFTQGVYTFGANFVDLDNDGYLDLAISGDFHTAMLFWNNQNGTFTETSKTSGLLEIENAMGSSFADINGDGYLDWYMTGIFDKRAKDKNTGFGVKGNFLYLNNGNRTFTNVAPQLGVQDAGWGWGCSLFDVNNDGNIDAFISSGFVMTETTFEDIFNISPSRMFVNPGKENSIWQDIAKTSLFPSGDHRQGRGVILLDYDRDGDLDVLVVNHASKPYFYENKMVSRGVNFFQVGVYEYGRISHGAMVKVTDYTGIQQTGVVGAATGFQGQSEPIVHFGLGNMYDPEKLINKVEIYWPSSNITKIIRNIPRNHRLIVTMPEKKENTEMSNTIPYCNKQKEIKQQLFKVEKESVDVESYIKNHLPPLEPFDDSLKDLFDFVISHHQSNNKMEFRSFDGYGNNEENPMWGNANSKLVRRVENGYEDGISKPPEKGRPSARELSNSLCSGSVRRDNPSPTGLSDFTSHFGQLLAHDIDHTTPQANTIEKEYFPIKVPKNDPVFDPENTGTEIIRFRRSIFDPATGVNRYKPREQLNKVTSFVDASVVYGSNEDRAFKLRAKVKGLLLMSNQGMALPKNDIGLDNDNPLHRKTESLYLAGDARANIQPGLFALHTIFAREHNYLARHVDRIASLKYGKSLSDDEIFFLARRILIVLFQIIVYNEYLPALLGEEQFFTAKDTSTNQSWDYDKSVNPGIFNTFSTSAFRLGHAQANNDFELKNENMKNIRIINLDEVYFKPPNSTVIDAVLRGSLGRTCKAIDLKMSDNLRNRLFGPKHAGGVDLAAINIQRGRDHGLNHYNQIRKGFNLSPLTEFSQFDGIDRKTVRKLKSLYKNNINNIDPFIGLLSEQRLDGGELGETNREIISQQFRNLAIGDRFFYKNIIPKEITLQLERKQSIMLNILKRHVSINNYPYLNPFYVPKAKKQRRN